MRKKRKSLVLKIKFEILIVCFKEEIFLKQIWMIHNYGEINPDNSGKNRKTNKQILIARVISLGRSDN